MSDQGRSGDRYPPLSTYALLGDCHSAALVSRDGSIDWCCFHRFDARPVFARLLDWSRGGHFRVAPAGTAYTIGRRYLPGTNVLETRMATSAGSITVTDCLVVRRGALAGDAAQTRSHQLLRLVYCEAGEVDVAPSWR
jgi:alpha,alpha-trehalase